ncbi:MAG: hypothetical protein ABI128_04855 [Rhodanobacter sp.]
MSKQAACHSQASGGRKRCRQDPLLERACSPAADVIGLVVSDIEMPRLDGYALNRAIREAPALRQLTTVLHSLLSGGFNEAIIQAVKVDRFVVNSNPTCWRRQCWSCCPKRRRRWFRQRCADARASCRTGVNKPSSRATR